MSMNARKGKIIATKTRNVPTRSVLLSVHATVDTKDPVTVVPVSLCLFCTCFIPHKII